MHCTQIFTNNKNIIEMCSNHNLQFLELLPFVQVA
jgi:hypothetical protein